MQQYLLSAALLLSLRITTRTVFFRWKGDSSDCPVVSFWDQGAEAATHTKQQCCILDSEGWQSRQACRRASASALTPGCLLYACGIQVARWEMWRVNTPRKHAAWFQSWPRGARASWISPLPQGLWRGCWPIPEVWRTSPRLSKRYVSLCVAQHAGQESGHPYQIAVLLLALRDSNSRRHEQSCEDTSNISMAGTASPNPAVSLFLMTW